MYNVADKTRPVTISTFMKNLKNAGISPKELKDMPYWGWHSHCWFVTWCDEKVTHHNNDGSIIQD